MTKGVKESLQSDIMQNQDVLFQWSWMAASVDETVGTMALRRIVELYTTIRGFAFASSCIELYKSAHKKKIQKSRWRNGQGHCE